MSEVELRVRAEEPETLDDAEAKQCVGVEADVVTNDELHKAEEGDACISSFLPRPLPLRCVPLPLLRLPLFLSPSFDCDELGVLVVDVEVTECDNVDDEVLDFTSSNSGKCCRRICNLVSCLRGNDVWSASGRSGIGARTPVIPPAAEVKPFTFALSATPDKKAAAKTGAPSKRHHCFLGFLA